MPRERWKKVVGAEGRYEVSDRGRVRSVSHRVLCSHGAHRISPGKLLSPGRMNRFGHVTVHLGRKPGQGSKCVHALVLEAFVGPRPKGFDACHKNGNGGDNRLCNLRWASRSENNRDITKHNRRKLSHSQADEIRLRREKGEKGSDLARKFGVSQSTIHSIVVGKSYVR